MVGIAALMLRCRSAEASAVIGVAGRVPLGRARHGKARDRGTTDQPLTGRVPKPAPRSDLTGLKQHLAVRLQTMAGVAARAAAGRRLSPLAIHELIHGRWFGKQRSGAQTIDVHVELMHCSFKTN